MMEKKARQMTPEEFAMCIDRVRRAYSTMEYFKEKKKMDDYYEAKRLQEEAAEREERHKWLEKCMQLRKEGRWHDDNMYQAAY